MSSFIASIFKAIFSIFNLKSKNQDFININEKEIIKSMETRGKVVIDPGHGGKNKRPDPGAVGTLNNEPLYERNVVLEISIHLAYLLDKAGFKVVLTRINNETLSELKDKVKIARDEQPDIFVSIHANSNAGRPAQGIETFYHSLKPKSKSLSNEIQKSLMSYFPAHRNRGIKQGDHLYVLKAHSIEPCCLVECEFINHPEQARFLVENSKEIAEAIANGIINYNKQQ